MTKGFEDWAARVDSELERRIFAAMLTKTQVRRQALELSPEDRIDLAVEIWDSLKAKDMGIISKSTPPTGDVR